MKKIGFIISVMLSVLMLGVSALAQIKYLYMDITYSGKTEVYSAQEVYILVDGRELTELPMPPIIFEGYTLVPAREVFEALGASVEWKADLEQVYIQYKDILTVLTIDFETAYVNGVERQMSVPARIINDKTMIPVRFVSEAIGLNVGWSNETRTISITTAEVVTEETVAPTTESIIAEEVVVANEDTGSEEETHAQENNNSSESGSLGLNVKSVTLPYSGNTSFTITANGPIESYESFVLEPNRLVVDINKATNLVSPTQYVVNHPFVSEVRVGQFKTSPLVTRVVFVMDLESEYNISQSADKTQIYLNFDKNSIKSISAKSEGSSDIISFTGDSAPAVVAGISGDVLTAQIDYASLGIPNGSLGAGVFYSSGEYKVEDNKVILTLKLKDNVRYKLASNGNVTKLTLFESSFKNLSYNGNAHTLAIKKNSRKISYNSAKHTDDYNNLQYTITFDGDYSAVFGDGEFEINDAYLKNAVISTENDKTSITFNENRILAYNVVDDNENLYIEAVTPKEKYDKILVLDAGHGGKDNGASGNGIIEKDITLDIVNQLISFAESEGEIKIYASRTTDVYPSFDERTDLGNEVGDVFVSVHINSAPGAAANGTETYKFNDNTTASGLSSSILADAIHEKMVGYLRTNDRGVKSANFIVLRQSNMPAVLCEVAFISNAVDAKNLASSGFRQKAAYSIYDAVNELFDEYPPTR